ncbi:MAG: S26 family signal peptidase [Desulfobacterales bacterium]
MFPELVTDLLKDGYKVSFNAPGHSMYPTIMANETVVVGPVEPSAIHKGDILLFRSNGSLVAHRVMGIVKDDKANEYATLLKSFCPDEGPGRSSIQSLFFILRGDAARTFDEPVTSEQVLGKVISLERNGKIINPYSLKHKLTGWAHRWAARLKRYLFFSHNHKRMVI